MRKPIISIEWETPLFFYGLSIFEHGATGSFLSYSSMTFITCRFFEALRNSLSDRMKYSQAPAHTTLSIHILSPIRSNHSLVNSHTASYGKPFDNGTCYKFIFPLMDKVNRLTNQQPATARTLPVINNFVLDNPAIRLGLKPALSLQEAMAAKLGVNPHKWQLPVTFKVDSGGCLIIARNKNCIQSVVDWHCEGIDSEYCDTIVLWVSPDQILYPICVCDVYQSVVECVTLNPNGDPDELVDAEELEWLVSETNSWAEWMNKNIRAAGGTNQPNEV